MLSESTKRKLADKSFFARILRYKFKPYDFLPHEKLYRGFKKDDLPDDTGMLAGNHFTFPKNGGISCDWSRFAQPADVRRRRKDTEHDGCYSFTVEHARYNGKASTCHDPCPKDNPKNYAHMEIRQLRPKDDPFHEPPKYCKRLEKESDGWSKSCRLAYREYISLKLTIEIEPLV
jgi:hypothetical protein